MFRSSRPNTSRSSLGLSSRLGLPSLAHKDFARGLKALGFAAFLITLSTPAWARDQIRMVGSSTVYPFATIVAEHFAEKTKEKAPIVESTGTGGGFKLFCEGIGEETPDFVTASRKIKKTEFENCKKNGVTDLVELTIGFDGLSLAQGKQAPDLALTKKQIFLALAREIPGPDGKLHPNPHKTWADVDPSLPHDAIEVLGPPPTSGTRDSFVELIMEKGAEEIPVLKALKEKDPKAFESVWKALREDGAYVDAGENDNLIVQKLANNPHAVGIFGFSFLEENRSVLKDISIDGVAATYTAIADRSYRVARPLYVYVKKQHLSLVPAMGPFIEELSSEDAIGEEGYLSEKGLVTLPGEDLKKSQEISKNLPLVNEHDL